MPFLLDHWHFWHRRGKTLLLAAPPARFFYYVNTDIIAPGQSSYLGVKPGPLRVSDRTRWKHQWLKSAGGFLC